MWPCIKSLLLVFKLAMIHIGFSYEFEVFKIWMCCCSYGLTANIWTEGQRFRSSGLKPTVVRLGHSLKPLGRIHLNPFGTRMLNSIGWISYPTNNYTQKLLEWFGNISSDSSIMLHNFPSWILCMSSLLRGSDRDWQFMLAS